MTDLEPESTEPDADELVWQSTPHLPADAYRAISAATRRAQDRSYQK
jgi:hypothetical protein